MVDHAAARFFDAVCAGDADTLEAALGHEFRAWHNTDDVWQTRSEHLATLAWLHRRIQSIRYEGVTRLPLPGGFTQWHVMRGTVDGAEWELRACIIGFIDPAGKLLETREYIDSKQLRALFDAARE